MAVEVLPHSHLQTQGTLELHRLYNKAAIHRGFNTTVCKDILQHLVVHFHKVGFLKKDKHKYPHIDACNFQTVHLQLKLEPGESYLNLALRLEIGRNS